MTTAAYPIKAILGITLGPLRSDERQKESPTSEELCQHINGTARITPQGMQAAKEFLHETLPWTRSIERYPLFWHDFGEPGAGTSLAQAEFIDALTRQHGDLIGVGTIAEWEAQKKAEHARVANAAAPSTQAAPAPPPIEHRETPTTVVSGISALPLESMSAVQKNSAKFSAIRDGDPEALRSLVEYRQASTKKNRTPDLEFSKEDLYRAITHRDKTKRVELVTLLLEGGATYPPEMLRAIKDDALALIVREGSARNQVARDAQTPKQNFAQRALKTMRNVPIITFT